MAKSYQIDEALFKDLCLWFLDDTGDFKTVEREERIKQGLNDKLAKIERRASYVPKNVIKFRK